MWARRFFALALCASAFAACGGKSVKTVGGEAGSGSGCDDTLCGDDCVDVTRDPSHCGGCFERCGSNESCVTGRCVEETSCRPPRTDCGVGCVDLSSNPYHCGSCGNECSGACIDGSCESSCPSGRCGTRCVDFDSDPTNCGGCGFQCMPGQYCTFGTCAGGCPGSICGGACVDLSSDPFNCGSCGSTCVGDDVYCLGGQCQGVCPPDALYCNGSCVDWRYDPANCGGCGFRCLGGQECIQGTCIDACPSGTWCNGNCVDLSSDPNNCGQCFSTCSMPNRCIGGMCVDNTGRCGNGAVEPGEEADPPPGPLASVVPLDAQTCRYDFSRITQWYCHGTCGNWGGGPADCDQLDADSFCKLKMDNARSVALSWGTARAASAPGVCCPPPSNPPGSLGCTTVGVLSSRGVSVPVSVHPTDLYSTHQAGTVITNLQCSDP
jgi:hypothetical protein